MIQAVKRLAEVQEQTCCSVNVREVHSLPKAPNAMILIVIGGKNLYSSVISVRSFSRVTFLLLLLVLD